MVGERWVFITNLSLLKQITHKFVLKRMAISVLENRSSIKNFRFSTGTHYLFPKRRASVSIFGTMTIYLPNALKEVDGDIDGLNEEIDKLFLTEFVCLTASASAVTPLCEKLNRCPIVGLVKKMREINN